MKVACSLQTHVTPVPRSGDPTVGAVRGRVHSLPLWGLSPLRQARPGGCTCATAGICKGVTHRLDATAREQTSKSNCWLREGTWLSS